MLLENLQPGVLAFQRDQPRLKRSSITLDIVKNLRRGQTVTVQYLDSNGQTVTVQCQTVTVQYLDSNGLNVC